MTALRTLADGAGRIRTKGSLELELELVPVAGLGPSAGTAVGLGPATTGGPASW